MSSKIWNSVKRNIYLRYGESGKLLLVLLATWFVVFYFNETIVPHRAALQCEWPRLSVQHDSSNYKDTNTGINVFPEQTNILLIADPQLIDNHTYPGRNGPLLKLSQHTVDQYIKRNYRALLNKLDPEYIFFLGDLLDNGRGSTDDYFAHEVERFRSVFPPRQHMYTNLPGNHDIGFGDLIRIDVRDRFTRTFGQPNYSMKINGVDLIMLDTTSLSSTKDIIKNPTQHYISQLPEKTSPRILLTHVPLFRDPQLSCGPHRETSRFDVLGHGYQYQNSLTSQISNHLMETVKPDLIFSGDDHDYCDIEHEEGIREITVKSISMAMGRKYPAVQLLSFTTDAEKKLNYYTDICYLQTPYINIIVYLTLAVISAIIVFWMNMKKTLYLQNVLPIAAYKEKKIANKGLMRECAKDSAIVGIGALLIYVLFIVK